ncbi:hypothetical protein J7T55_001118 [Diaporthe amygdali]|uniref:uncharacterized protein n=1 Tax=Phomopsis amygdali TaxID=1214568 RepID=UPI0022FF1901|nr:uncharacterized protein J7T55_001118 [Diaporthe amygdali]KAJ0120261.1 hypothetical protein J7T55_001118 [Diaporthe amygdali]
MISRHDDGAVSAHPANVQPAWITSHVNQREPSSEVDPMRSPDSGGLSGVAAGGYSAALNSGLQVGSHGGHARLGELSLVFATPHLSALDVHSGSAETVQFAQCEVISRAPRANINIVNVKANCWPRQ